MASELSPAAGGIWRTINSVPAALKRLYCLVVSLFILNLGTTYSHSLSDTLLPDVKSSFSLSDSAILLLSLTGCLCLHFF